MRAPKRKEAILQTAIDAIISYRNNNSWGERIYYILLRIWATAFQRGYVKGLCDADKEAREKVSA